MVQGCNLQPFLSGHVLLPLVGERAPPIIFVPCMPACRKKLCSPPSARYQNYVLDVPWSPESLLQIRTSFIASSMSWKCKPTTGVCTAYGPESYYEPKSVFFGLDRPLAEQTSAAR